jgi:hypothetical protein
MTGGLLRLGVALPAPAEWTLVHGPLVVTGFLGTLIGLERAMGLGGGAWSVPVTTAASAMTLVCGARAPIPAALAVAGSALAIALFTRLCFRQPERFLVVMTLGIAAWCTGNVLWWRELPMHRAAPWWAVFLTLVIAGERLELTRLFRPSRAAGPLGAAPLALIAGGMAATLLGAPDAGIRVTGIGLVALAAWLVRFDVARRNLRALGLTRFMAIALLAGYAWLAVAGVLWLGVGPTDAGMLHDAALHAVFLGFVFAMIFAHAPVILPSVLGVRIVFAPRFYAPLALLQATLVLRLGADLAGDAVLRRWGAAGNALAIVLFFATVAHAALARGLGTSRPRRQ